MAGGRGGTDAGACAALQADRPLPSAPEQGPARHDGAHSLRRRWLSLAVLLSGNFMTILDLFIVNVALGSIQRDLGASFAQIQLVLVAYSVAYGVFLMNAARLGDLFGRRRLFLIGMGVFTAASALCGLAPTPALLIVARVFQGVGAARS